MEGVYGQEKSELEALRESVYSLAEALTLLRDIFVGQGAAFNSDPFKRFTKIVEDVRVKTSQSPQ
jgi:hypothetical protein